MSAIMSLARIACAVFGTAFAVCIAKDFWWYGGLRIASGTLDAGATIFIITMTAAMIVVGFGPKGGAA